MYHRQREKCVPGRGVAGPTSRLTAEGTGESRGVNLGDRRMDRQ